MTDPIVEELQISKTTAPMIIVLGQTGSGKSHFINRLAGKQVVRESPRLESCTKKVEMVEVRVNESDFIMVDTPGFNDTWRDTSRSDAQILNELARILVLQVQMGVKMRGILFLYDIRNPRITGENRRQIELIKLVCGQRNYSNVTLVTTHWPKVFDEQQIEHNYALREADLRMKFWKDMVRGGSKILRFDDEEDTAKAIIGGIAPGPNVTLAIQEEMAEGRDLRETSAASFVITAQRDEKSPLEGLKNNDKSLQDSTNISQTQSVERFREVAAVQIDNNVVSKIRREIRHLYEEAQRQRKKLTAARVMYWLINISELTTQVVQTALTS